MSKLRLALAVGNRDFCSLFEDYISMCCDIELVGSTTDGLVALELVKQKKPDVLVMDNVMTHIDGLGVLTKLQNTIAFKRPKVIIISASPTENFMLTACKLGVCYQMSRSIDIEEIIKFVYICMNKPTRILR